MLEVAQRPPVGVLLSTGAQKPGEMLTKRNIQALVGQRVRREQK